MRIFRHATAIGPNRGAVVAIGNFDGVHLGHQQVIAAGRVLAARDAVPFAVFTFEPHPRSVFQPGTAPFRLTPFRSKALQLAALGVDLLIAQRFDLAFARTAAEDFVRRELMAGLGVRHLVVGYDFVFGARRRGTAAVLSALGAAEGFGVEVVGPITSAAGEAYSSTRIREHLTAGRPGEAAALLGRFWEVDGRVRQGDRLGRTIGFPTANLRLGDYLRPAPGVYAVRIGVEEAGEEAGGIRWYDGAANLGWRPTVGGQDLRLEAHLFDFAGDLYGRSLRVAFVAHLRPEQRFAGLDALKAQIAADCARAREILAAAPASRGVATADLAP